MILYEEPTVDEEMTGYEEMVYREFELEDMMVYENVEVCV